MKQAKWGLLAATAGLTTVASAAQAADLPRHGAAPVEYVRVCTAYGAGYFYVPGTDTCLRVGGRVRFSYQYMSSRQTGPSINGVNAANSLVNRDNSGFQSLSFLNFDARTQTSYGTLRTFIRLIAAYNSGGYLTSGTAQRFGTAYPALGQDTFGRAQSQIFLDKAFIQFAGFTAGRASSFFDFYAHDLEHFAATSGSDVPSTNLLAYTATFGGGWSATISIEDPITRRQPIYSNLAFGSTGVGTPFSLLNDQVGGLTTVGGTFTQSVPYTAPDGSLRFANYDVAQRSLMPDVVGAIRYDASWGSAQVSAAMHELRGGALVNSIGTSTSALTGLVAPTGSASQGVANSPAGLPSKVREEIGYAVQGGLKLNLPQLATGDVLWLQAAYSEGALSYSGHPARFAGSESLASPYSGRFVVSTVDSFLGRDGKQKLTEAWSVTAAFLHYWSPQWRSAAFGSYAEVNFGKGARSWNSPGNLIPGTLPVVGSSAGVNSLAANTALRDYSVAVLGANLIWSPVKDLDIGLEGVYTRVDLKNGRAADQSYGSALLPSATGPGTAINGRPARSAKFDDVWSVRMRVQRDF